MRQPFGVQPRPGAGTHQQVDRALFQHPGADAAEHVLRRLALQDHVVDAVLRQQRPEHQAGRAAADDRHLGPHHCCHPVFGRSMAGTGAPHKAAGTALRRPRDPAPHHRGGNAGRRGIADRQAAQGAHRQQREAFRLDGVATPADRFRRDRLDPRAAAQRRHQRRVLATAAAHDQPVRPMRQQIQPAPDGRRGEGRQRRRAIFQPQPVRHGGGEVEAIERFRIGRRQVRVAEQGGEAGLVDHPLGGQLPAFVHAGAGRALHPIVDRLRSPGRCRSR